MTLPGLQPEPRWGPWFSGSLARPGGAVDGMRGDGWPTSRAWLPSARRQTAAGATRGLKQRHLLVTW